MKEYVLGFVLNPTQICFVAIQKNRPEHHKGLLNAPGGSVEQGESTLDAVRREVWEEAGLNIQSWHKFAEMIYVDRRITCYTSFSHVPPRTVTDEPVFWTPIVNVITFPERFVPSTRWLLIMALCLKDGVSIIDRRMAVPHAEG